MRFGNGIMVHPSTGLKIKEASIELEEGSKKDLLERIRIPFGWLRYKRPIWQGGRMVGVGGD